MFPSPKEKTRQNYVFQCNPLSPKQKNQSSPRLFCRLCSLLYNLPILLSHSCDHRCFYMDRYTHKIETRKENCRLETGEYLKIS